MQPSGHGYAPPMLGDFGLDLLRDGYRAIPRIRAEHHGADVLPVRLLGRPALVVRGHEAAKRFYDPEVIRRRDAVPGVLSALLFGRGAVHGLDGSAHQQRKGQFLSLLDAQAAQDLGDLVADLLPARLARHLERAERADVFDLLVEVYGHAVLTWAGVAARDPIALSHCLADIVDGFGGAGLAYPRAVAARIRADRWARSVIRAARDESVTDRPLGVVAQWRDENDELLPTAVAAVELINVLRPAVAVAFLGSFAVSAVDEHAQWRAKLADPSVHDVRRAFVQEVRRLAPFVPALAGRTRTATEWSGHSLHRGRRVILDVPGIDTDESLWPDPHTFDPARFLDEEVDPYELVPQGGGPAEGHRCPGEPATIAILEATVTAFAQEHERAPWRVLARGHDPRRIPARERLVLAFGEA